MKTSTIRAVASVLVLVGLGCGGIVNEDPSGASQPVQESQDDTSYEESRDSEDVQPNGQSEHEESRVGSCSPIRDDLFTCTHGWKNTYCCALTGDVFLWYPSAECKTLVHSRYDGTYECMDSGLPVAQYAGACGAGWAITCYERSLGDDIVEVIESIVYHFGNSYESLGWRRCSEELRWQVYDAPACL